MVKVIDIVGSSMAMRGSGSGLLASAMVSPISKPSNPTIAQMSPERTDCTRLRLIPSNTCSSLMRCLLTEPSFRHRAMSMFSRISPRCTRPIAMRPTYDEKSSDVISICASPSSTCGAGIYLMIASSTALMLSVGLRQSSLIHPCLAEPYMVGEVKLVFGGI